MIEVLLPSVPAILNLAYSLTQHFLGLAWQQCWTGLHAACFCPGGWPPSVAPATSRSSSSGVGRLASCCLVCCTCVSCTTCALHHAVQSEELGAQMAHRALEHLLQYGEPAVRYGIIALASMPWTPLSIKSSAMSMTPSALLVWCGLHSLGCACQWLHELWRWLWCVQARRPPVPGAAERVQPRHQRHGHPVPSLARHRHRGGHERGGGAGGYWSGHQQRQVGGGLGGWHPHRPWPASMLGFSSHSLLLVAVCIAFWLTC